MDHTLASKTEEQEIIIKQLETDNLIIEAVAGSGKTTTSLYIAKHFKQAKILLLTYNTKLKMETRTKISALNFTNIEAHSFHSFGYNYYDEKKCSTDSGIQEIIKEQKAPAIIIDFNIIIIDEAQDINPWYYEFICKIIKNNRSESTICLLGDKYQSIYSFNKADARYLSLADQFFNFNNKTWSKCTLSQTFRVNDKIVAFINNVFYQKDFMVAFKKSTILPEYLIANIYDNNNFYQTIKTEIINFGIENTFILAPSLKSGKSPVRNIANRLVNDGITIFIPTSDDEDIKDKDLQGKLVFCTFHQAKGLERKLVLVFGFDDSYYKFYARHHNRTIPANTLYVAITRACEKLILIHHYKNNFLPFLNKEKLATFCKIKKFLTAFEETRMNYLSYDDYDNYEAKSISVSDLIRHIPQNILNKCTNLIKVTKISEANNFKTIRFKTHVKEKNYFENVLTITGVAIPLYYEWSTKAAKKPINTVKILLNLLQERKDLTKDLYPDLFKYEKEIKKMANLKTLDIKSLLFLANLILYLHNRYNFKLKQISQENYNWITLEELEQSRQLLSHYVTNTSLHNVEYHLAAKPELHNKILLGFIDCIDWDKKTIWEFKCVSKVKETHFLQLALYAYLFIANQKELTNINNKATIFDPNLISVGDIISMQKEQQITEGQVIKIKTKSIIIKNSSNDRKEKVTKKNFVKNISSEEKAQATLVASFNYFLLNLKKNEIYELTFTFKNLSKIVDLLIWNKYFEFGKMTEKEFIETNNQIKQKYLTTS